MQRNRLLVRSALFANAAFSTLTGGLFVARAAAIAPRVGELPDWLFTAVGAGLLGFASWVAWVAWRPRPSRVLLISVLDLAWVVGTVPLLFVPGLLTELGVAAVSTVAAVVSLFALAQLVGVERMMRPSTPERGRWRHCVRVRTDASADAMWSVVSDLGEIARFTPTLVRSELEGGAAPAVGAVRTCSNPAGQTWSEACEAFDPGERSFTVRFMTERPGFPYPARVMWGGWRIEPDGDGSTVEVWWSLTPTIRPGWLVVALMGMRIDSDFASMIGRMAAVANGHPLPETPVRLAPGYC